MRPQIFQTSITELLGIRHPLLCGGLGPGVSDGRYVAAAVNAGGMGFIVATGYDDPAQFEEELKTCRALTAVSLLALISTFPALPAAPIACEANCLSWKNTASLALKRRVQARSRSFRC